MPEKNVRVVLFVPETLHKAIVKHFCENEVVIHGERTRIGKPMTQAYIDLIRLALQAMEEGDEGNG